MFCIKRGQNLNTFYRYYNVEEEIILATRQTTRKVHKLGDSKAITLPPKWVKENDIQQGDKLLLIYNGIVKVTLIFEVKIEGDSVWFSWKDKKVGLKITEVQRLVKRHGLDEALQLIKSALVERNGFPHGFPIDMMREKLLPYVVEFVK